MHPHLDAKNRAALLALIYNKCGTAVTLPRRKYLARFRAAGGNLKGNRNKEKGLLGSQLGAVWFLPCELRLKKLLALLTPAGCPLLGQGSEMGLCMRQPTSAEESRGGGRAVPERAPSARSTRLLLLLPGHSAASALTFLFPDFFTHLVRTSPFSRV